MNASQVAALGDLPENQPRRVFLFRRIRTAIALCHCLFPLPALAAYGSFLCFHDRIWATQAAVSGITGACDARHWGNLADRSFQLRGASSSSSSAGKSTLG